MDMMKVFAFNMKKYRKKKRISQMKLAEMLDSSTSYIGQIEINSGAPSMEMVERIAHALGVEPFRLFVEDESFAGGDIPAQDDYLKNLSTLERQDLSKRIIGLVSHDIEKLLQPEKTG